MGLNYGQESAYIQELSKWESLPTEQVRTPKRPYVYHEFPRMLYKASRPPAGGTVEFESRIVETELEQSNLFSRGWCVNQAVALEELDKAESAIGKAAAERAAAERRMSEKARAEASAFDDASDAHVPEITETPIRRRGRPKKAE